MPHCKLPLVAILRGITPSEVLLHAEKLVAAGFSMIEVPTNSPEWEKSIQLLQQRYGNNLLIGAGTVTDVQKLDQFITTQGRLLVTPNTNLDVIHLAKKAGLFTCIGAMTPSEAFSAIQAGADIIKLFPVNTLGIEYISALRSVLPSDTPIYAVGGVTPDNLADYLNAGCQGAGLGSDLYRKGQSPEVTYQKALAFVQAYEQAFEQK